MEESWRRKWKVVRKWNVVVWKGILFLFSVSWHHPTLLQTHWASVALKCCPVWFVFVYVLMASVFVTQDTVRHPRRFVFGKFVRKPNCSWSEAFVNRGLTVWSSLDKLAWNSWLISDIMWRSSTLNFTQLFMKYGKNEQNYIQVIRYTERLPHSWFSENSCFLNKYFF